MKYFALLHEVIWEQLVLPSQWYCILFTDIGGDLRGEIDGDIGREIFSARIMGF